MLVTNATTRPYDLIILGSGPAGISVARKYSELNPQKAVLIVDSGGFDHGKAHELSKVVAEGDLQEWYYPTHAQRVFGGGTSVWNGWCTVLEERSFNTGDWPIEYEDLAAHYPEAAEMLELSKLSHQQPSIPIGSRGSLVYKPFFMSPPVRFGTKYRKEITNHPSIDLLLAHTCVRLVPDPDNNIMAIELRKTIGASARSSQMISATNYVLACGGIGNPRLLQLSKLPVSDQVGRQFCEHPHIYSAVRMSVDMDAVEEFRYGPEHKVTDAFQFSDDFCKENDILSFSISFTPAKLRQDALLGKAGKFASVDLAIRSEMSRQDSNRVELTQELDLLGQPRTKVQFQFNYVNQLRKSWNLFLEELLRSGIARPQALKPPVTVTGGGHYICTTRMGETATDSVVDENCKVHGISNLYVAGSSVFSAPGAANPTFSIVALGLRLGEHLAEQ